MDLATFGVQLLNAIQYGMVLFLVASGLTLVFGILGVINLAHGTFYMLGAYLAYGIATATGSFWLAMLGGVAIAFVAGLALENVFIRRLYGRDHLAQVLLSFGLILVLDDIRQIVFGKDVHSVAPPQFLSGSFQLTDNMSYSVYRLAICVFCLAVAAVIFFVVQRTKIGMIVRAGRREPRDDARARHQLRPDQPLCVRGRHCARRPRRHRRVADLDGVSRHGRRHADPVVRGDRRRRHRLDHRSCDRRAA